MTVKSNVTAMRIVTWAAVSVFACMPASSIAQTYPAKPVRIIVSHAAGGPPGIATRGLGTILSQAMGQPFVVESRDGSNGIIGAEAVAKSAPDGYTLLVTSASTLTMNQFVYTSLPYDPERDFAPVAHIGNVKSAVVVHPSVPANSMQELMALVKAKPDSISFGTVGTSGVATLYVEWMRKVMGAPFYAIPYKNYPQGFAAVTAGDVQAAIFVNAAVMPHARSGKVRVLATAADERSSYTPDAPSFKEVGFDVFFRVWFGLYAPAATPQPIVLRLSAETAKALVNPVMSEKFLVPQGFEVQPPAGGTPAEFAKYIREERDMYRRALKVIGLKPE
jgi:tripartite-type tricarboxylate transporter receptor subunit TctC